MKKIVIISGVALALVASSYMAAQMYIEDKVSEYLENFDNNSPISGITFTTDSVYYNPFEEALVLKGVESNISNALIKQNIDSIYLERVEFTYPISTFFGVNNLVHFGESFAKIKGGQIKFSSDAIERFLSGIGRPPFLKGQGVNFSVNYTSSLNESDALLSSSLYIENVGDFNFESQITGPFDEISEIISDAEKSDDGSLNLSNKEQRTLETQFKKFAGRNVSLSYSSENIADWLNFLSRVSPLVNEGDLHGVNDRIKLDLEKNGLFTDDYRNSLHNTLSDAIDTEQDVRFSIKSGIPIDMNIASQIFMMAMAGGGTPESLSNLIKADYNLELINFKKP